MASFNKRYSAMITAGYSPAIAGHFATVASEHAATKFYSIPDQSDTPIGVTAFASSIGIDYGDHFGESSSPEYSIYALATVNNLASTTTTDLGEISIPRSAGAALASPHSSFAGL